MHERGCCHQRITQGHLVLLAKGGGLVEQVLVDG
jgi:hypothetical protein